MYLVTGGAGFIGSHIDDRLVEQGKQVRVLDDLAGAEPRNLTGVLDQIELIDGDIRDVDAVRRALKGVEVVFHQAAIASVQQSIDDPHETLDVNVNGTLHVLEAARDASCRRVVFASSAAVYGDSPELPKTEDMLPKPMSPYAVSKLAGEHLCAVYSQVHGLETVSLRYFNVFGPRQDPSSPYSGVISRFVEAIRKGESPVIYGDGEQTRDFVYVGDVVEANLLAAEAGGVAGQVYNIGEGIEVSLNELLRTICEVTGTSRVPTYLPERTGDIRHSVACTSEAKRAFGFRPGTRLEDGLAKLISVS